MKIFKDFPNSKPKNDLLSKVNFPADLKKLDLNELEILADELREFLLQFYRNILIKLTGYYFLYFTNNNFF